MGEVYRVRDTRLDRDVAVKVLPANLSSDPSLRQRLEREAKAVSKLSHPHICKRPGGFWSGDGGGCAGDQDNPRGPKAKTVPTYQGERVGTPLILF
jgi:serine/threonine protein kinase